MTELVELLAVAVCCIVHDPELRVYPVLHEVHTEALVLEQVLQFVSVQLANTDID